MLVSSGTGFAPIAVRVDFVIAFYFFGTEAIRRSCKTHVFRWRTRFAGVGARATLNPRQAENEVPQPQDFVACGFTNTNPCCISVS